MTTEKLEKSAWHSYFDGISKVLSGKQAEIEVNSLRIGAQVESRYAPFLGIVYDQKSAIIEVLLEGLDHTISNVRDVFIEHDGVHLSSILVIDTDDVQQVIRLRDPLMLAPPARA